jgi:hypothetical protein
MPTALDKASSIIARRCKYLCRTAATFFAACSRYPLRLLDGRATNPDSLHALSQVMIVSPKLRRLHGMTTANEKAYLYWYGKHIFTGKGDIVHLGCWLGSTNISLAIGLGPKNPAQTYTHIHG